MLDFELVMYNIPMERLSNPRMRLKGINIPQNIINLLPLKIHSFEQITENTESIKLLYFFDNRLFDNVADLKEFISNDDLYRNSYIASEDTSTADFLCTALTYQFIAKRLLQYFVGDDTAFAYHLPFLAEATNDIECSYYLMKGGYFKQSLQTLRNVLEVTLLHAYFSLKYLDDDDLQSVIKHKYPNLKELIRFLKVESIITPNLETEYLRSYKDLSLAVHSEIEKLTVMNNFTYKRDFSKWYIAFTKVSKIHIQTMMRMAKIGI